MSFITNQGNIGVCCPTIRREITGLACLDGITSGWDGKEWVMAGLSGERMRHDCLTLGVIVGKTNKMGCVNSGDVGDKRVDELVFLGLCVMCRRWSVDGVVIIGLPLPQSD